jgi:hypothetical protein
VILEWNADRYVEGFGYNSVSRTDIRDYTVGAVYDLIHTPWGMVWVQYCNPAQVEPPPTGFSLIYNGWTFVWVQYGGESRFSIWQSDGAGTCEFVAPPFTSGTFAAHGAGTCEFAPEALEFFWISQGAGGSDWILQGELFSGFAAAGAGTCVFYRAPNVLLIDGAGKASFVLESKEPPPPFRCEGAGGAQFLGSAGMGDECLTPPDTPLAPTEFPNYAY